MRERGGYHLRWRLRTVLLSRAAKIVVHQDKPESSVLDLDAEGLRELLPDYGACVKNRH